MQFCINKHLQIFQRQQIALTLQVRAIFSVFEKFTWAHLFQIALETISLPMQIKDNSIYYIYNLRIWANARSDWFPTHRLSSHKPWVRKTSSWPVIMAERFVELDEEKSKSCLIRIHQTIQPKKIDIGRDCTTVSEQNIGEIDTIFFTANYELKWNSYKLPVISMTMGVYPFS